VLDTSGSMKTNDPRYRSHLGAQIFVDMAGDGDRLGVLGMAKKGEIVTLTEVGAGRADIKARIKKVRHEGGTRCVEALHDALERLNARPGGEKLIVFLSDGECQTRTDDGLTLSGVLGDAEAAGVRIFSIGLGAELAQKPEAHQTLVQMAEATRGVEFDAPTAELLPAIFARIFGLSRGSRTRELTFEPGVVTLEVDRYVAELTLVVTPEEGGAMRVGAIHAPGGGAPAGLVELADTNRTGLPYLVLRVPRPAAGTWRIELNGDRTLHAATLQSFDLRPTLDALPPVVPVGEQVEVSGQLLDGDGKPVDADFARSVTFTLHVKRPGATAFTPAGPMKVDDAGRYLATFLADARGDWAVHAVATRAETLEATTAPLRTTARGIKLRALLAEPEAATVALGQPVPLRVELVSGDGKPIEPKVAEASSVTLYVRKPGADTFVRSQTLRHDDKGVFVGQLQPTARGSWAYYAVAERGDDNRAQSETREVKADALQLTAAVPTIDLGEIKAGQQREVTLDFGGSTLDREEVLQLDPTGLGDAGTPWPTDVRIAPDALVQTFTLAPPLEHDGGAFAGPLIARPATGVHANPVTFEVRYTVVPLSFLERWGTLLVTLLSVLAGLIGLFALVWGFVKPHAFPPHLRLFWGNDVERFRRNEVQLVKLPGGERGFYRNAKVTLGGPRCAVGLGGPVRITLEATGREEFTLHIEPGASLVRVNKFDHQETSPVKETALPVVLGQILKTDSLYFKVE